MLYRRGHVVWAKKVWRFLVSGKCLHTGTDEEVRERQFGGRGMRTWGAQILYLTLISTRELLREEAFMSRWAANLSSVAPLLLDKPIYKKTTAAACTTSLQIFLAISSVQFSHWVMSDSLQSHESQHARLPVHHQLLELDQTHVHWDGDVIPPSHPLSSSSPPAFNLSQHQGLFQ